MGRALSAYVPSIVSRSPGRSQTTFFFYIGAGKKGSVPDPFFSCPNIKEKSERLTLNLACSYVAARMGLKLLMHLVMHTHSGARTS